MANLREAKFVDTNLEGANLHKANLWEVTLNNALLRETIMPNGQRHG